MGRFPKFPVTFYRDHLTYHFRIIKPFLKVFKTHGENDKKLVKKGRKKYSKIVQTFTILNTVFNRKIGSTDEESLDTAGLPTKDATSTTTVYTDFIHHF